MVMAQLDRMKRDRRKWASEFDEPRREVEQPRAKAIGFGIEVAWLPRAVCLMSVRAASICEQQKGAAVSKTSCL